jgi:hypothetical protein
MIRIQHGSNVGHIDDSGCASDYEHGECCVPGRAKAEEGRLAPGESSRSAASPARSEFEEGSF